MAVPDRRVSLAHRGRRILRRSALRDLGAGLQAGFRRRHRGVRAAALLRRGPQGAVGSLLRRRPPGHRVAPCGRRRSRHRLGCARRLGRCGYVHAVAVLLRAYARGRDGALHGALLCGRGPALHRHHEPRRAYGTRLRSRAACALWAGVLVVEPLLHQGDGRALHVLAWAARGDGRRDRVPLHAPHGLRARPCTPSCSAS